MSIIHRDTEEWVSNFETHSDPIFLRFGCTQCLHRIRLGIKLVESLIFRLSEIILVLWMLFCVAAGVHAKRRIEDAMLCHTR